MNDFSSIVKKYLFQRLGLSEEFDELLRVEDVFFEKTGVSALEIRFLDIRFTTIPDCFHKPLGDEHVITVDRLIWQMRKEWLPLVHMRIRQMATLAEAIDGKEVVMDSHKCARCGFDIDPNRNYCDSCIDEMCDSCINKMLFGLKETNNRGPSMKCSECSRETANPIVLCHECKDDIALKAVEDWIRVVGYREPMDLGEFVDLALDKISKVMPADLESMYSRGVEMGLTQAKTAIYKAYLDTIKGGQR